MTNEYAGFCKNCPCTIVHDEIREDEDDTGKKHYLHSGEYDDGWVCAEHNCHNPEPKE